MESEKPVVLLYRVCFYDFHILDHLRSVAKIHFSTKVLMRERRENVLAVSLSVIRIIGKHVNNALKEELAIIPVVAKFATTASDGYVYENTDGYGYKPTNHYLSDITENMTIIRRTFIDKILLFSRDYHTQILCSSKHSKLYFSCVAPEINRYFD